ncbi:hypothetical protein D1818_03790 [Aquimarina sp. BL5]|uniref:hypothetical protein n=2 Tax=Aquimarina sp. BL5 TaxID=1714860 RepID=UPI000E503777|nr:hypothetical protein [Aquimarina sp. BL5]AXT49990.1 hypothetical protein D1818_03790 [Aquimarina sp. BL5]
MKKFIKIFFKALIIIFLTLFTQVGGVIYLIIELIVKRTIKNYRLIKASVFMVTYLIITFVIVPYLAPAFGREKIKNSDLIEACTLFTILSNRNYVTPELNVSLLKIAKIISKKHSNIKLIYLDANFPFMDGFPLPPHLSHNDGKKIDVSFIYTNNKRTLTNQKPALLGYGVYEGPNPGEYDQIKACKKKGYWQYDFAKYLTLGISNNQLKLSEKATKDLLLAIVNQQNVGKVFIEPHLESRLGVENPKIRFHGCQAVRHDDHIHLQLK